MVYDFKEFSTRGKFVITQKFLHIVLNHFTHDARVLREVTALAQPDREIEVYCFHKDGLPRYEEAGTHNVNRFRFWIRRGTNVFFIKFFLYIECIIRMTIRGTLLKPTVVHAHDLNALPIGYMVSMLTGAKLIYDSHEFWSDPVHKEKIPPLAFKILLELEKILSRRAVAVITVSDSIAEELYTNLHLQERPIVLRNVPEEIKENNNFLLRQALGISKAKTIVLYQGGITKARGLFMLLEAFHHINDENIVLVFMGDGVAVEDLKREIAGHPSKDRIYYQPAVKPGVLLSYTADADIGVHPMHGGLLNHEYALPNKLFEYIQAGIAVLVSDLKEMKAIVDHYQIGCTFLRDDKDALTTELIKMITDKSAIQAYRDNSRKAAKELNWTHEKSKLTTLYARVLADQ